MKFEDKKIIGVDEAGRGPLAGPVFAGAAYIKEEISLLKEIKDSKKISENKRERIFDEIMECDEIITTVSSCSHEIIDEINILEATKKAMASAVKALEEEGLVVIDGNFSIPIKRNQKSIPKADETILECSIASIVAKVSRDRLMREFAKIYPHYGFKSHKGYPTKLHKEAIAEYGICPIHRKTFKCT